MRTLVGPLGVVLGLVGLFLVLHAVAASRSIEFVVVAVSLVALGLVLLQIDESLSPRSR